MNLFEVICRKVQSKTKYQPNLELNCKSKNSTFLSIGILLVSLICAPLPWAQSGSPTNPQSTRRETKSHGKTLPPFDFLKSKALSTSEEDTQRGWVYMVSGAITLGASIPAYYLSEEPFAKGIYALAETLGVLAIGYGYQMLLLDNDYLQIYQVFKGVPDLTESQKNRMARLYLDYSATKAKKMRKIRAVTHGITAGLNFLNALTSSNRELKTAHFFLGGINILAVLQYSLFQSPEEAALSQIQSRNDSSLLALEVHF